MIKATIFCLLLIAGPSISYFKYQRPLEATASSGQHYIVVDEILWQHAQPGLEDLRLYSAQREVPYRLVTESASAETMQKNLRVLQPGTVGGKTQFLLDMSGMPDYDHIELKLTTRNFVAHARVEGQDDPHGAQWALLGTTTLYDLSDEKLGRNNALRIPLTTYQYLRVTVDNSVQPADVESATARVMRAEKAVWRDVGSEPKQAQADKDTVLTFSLPANVPAERLVFAIDPAQYNFRREIEIQGDNGEGLGSGELSRIHMQRSGQRVDVDQTSVDLHGGSHRTLKVIIHNGDDMPLKITGARLQQYERRIYFDSDAAAQPGLYYGDEKLGAPVYDYAKLFQKDAKADQVHLAAEENNAAYTGRPDERPWSERHPAVLWLAIILAVSILAAIALRSMKKATA